MTDHTGYEELIRAAIERESDVLGREDALRRANAVEGLSVDEEGEAIEVTGDGKAVLGELVDAYVEASGDVAAFLIARRIENLSDAGPELPANLDRHM